MYKHTVKKKNKKHLKWKEKKKNKRTKPFKMKRKEKKPKEQIPLKMKWKTTVPLLIRNIILITIEETELNNANLLLFLNTCCRS